MRDRLARFLDRIWYGPRAAAWWLLPLSWVYRAAFAIDRAVQLRRRRRAAVPVIVVGNLSVGGTGKTPLVIWLVHALRARGFLPGIVSRGYGGRRDRTARRVDSDAAAADVGDEPLLLARNTECPVAVCRDRPLAVDLLMRTTPIDIVVSDDGLQHHRLARACEIVVVDGARGFGNGFCLPAGPLREPVTRLASVDAIVVNGPGLVWADAIRGSLEPTRVERLDGSQSRPIASFRGERVHAFAAIGHPRRFFDLLSRHGMLVTEHPKPDHARISLEELRRVDGSTVMLTEKDAVKLGRNVPGNVWCVKVAYVFDASDAERLISAVLERLPSRSSA